jgi:hypothetical protein
MEVTAHIGPLNPADILMRKPLHTWTPNDVEQSVGAWRLLKKWPKEQLEQLLSLYESHWGPTQDWSDEQLEWLLKIGKCMDGDASSPVLKEQASPAVELVIG